MYQIVYCGICKHVVNLSHVPMCMITWFIPLQQLLVKSGVFFYMYMYVYESCLLLTEYCITIVWKFAESAINQVALCVQMQWQWFIYCWFIMVLGVAIMIAHTWRSVLYLTLSHTYTNFLQADVNGLKWIRYLGPNSTSLEAPKDDPVLNSYARLLNEG